MSFLVDANIILDIVTEDPKWFDWSSSVLAHCSEEGKLWINPIIYAEVSVHFERMEELDALFSSHSIERLPLPWDAGFLAGKCFLKYRQRGGVRESTLPDFFIGAHAAVAGMSVLTRDQRRYRTYFPKLNVIAPD